MTSEVQATILLVEDNPDHALLSKLAISRLDEVREVRLAVDGIQALEILRRGPLPDVVLLDLKLPRLDGFSVLERLRADPRLQEVPVFVLSTSGTDLDRTRSAALGANGYLRKPVDIERLRRMLRERARRGQQTFPF